MFQLWLHGPSRTGVSFSSAGFRDVWPISFRSTSGYVGAGWTPRCGIYHARMLWSVSGDLAAIRAAFPSNSYDGPVRFFLDGSGRGGVRRGPIRM